MIQRILTLWSQTVLHKLHNKLLLSFALVILIPLFILGSLLYSSAISLTKDNIQENRALEMQVLAQNLQQYFDSLELYSRVIYSEPIQLMLNAGYPDDLIERTRWKSNLFRRFNEWYGYMGIKAQIQNVTIVQQDGTMISSEPLYVQTSFADEPWYQHAYNSPGDMHIAGPMERTFRFQTSQTPYTFSLVRRINNSLGKSGLGSLVVDVNVMDISNLLARIGITNLTILNADHQIVYSDRSNQIGQVWSYGYMIRPNTSEWMDIDGQRMYVSTSYSDAIGWRFVTLDPLEQIESQSIAYRNLTIGTGLLALLIALIISTYISRRITKPIRTLQLSMKQVQAGNFNIRMDVQSADEVGQLTSSFNRMADEIYSLINNVFKSEIMRKEAQLKALQSQINPHFLYNTLDSMNAIAIIEDVPQLSRMTKMLSNMFRYSISAGDQVVPLHKELEQVIRYFEIQQIRYDDKFKLHVSVPDNLLDYPIPKLILQPIVENAIYHGLELIPGEGHIEILGYETDLHTIIEVKDNGIGLTPDRLEKLQGVLHAATDYEEHIGLANVAERIRLHYGLEYGIELHSEYESGTQVIYKLPLVKIKKKLIIENKND